MRHNSRPLARVCFAMTASSFAISPTFSLSLCSFFLSRCRPASSASYFYKLIFLFSALLLDSLCCSLAPPLTTRSKDKVGIPQNERAPHLGPARGGKMWEAGFAQKEIREGGVYDFAQSGCACDCAYPADPELLAGAISGATASRHSCRSSSSWYLAM